MARTILQIYDALIDEKETRAELNTLVPNPDDSQTFLNDLSSASKVAIWRLFYFVVAVGIWSLENIFDAHIVEVNAIADEVISGTARWLRRQALSFQFGDSLTYNSNNGRFEYLTINLANQIVKRAAVVEASGQVRIKIAKLSGGLPVPLSASELTSFTNYINQIKFAGTNIAITSADADLLKLEYEIFFDPLVLTPSGESILNPGVYPVEDAINAFIQELPFNGILNLTELTDAVQLADGVNDPVLNLAEARVGVVPFATINREYEADAGHMIIDPGFPLPGQITYTPEPATT